MGNVDRRGLRWVVDASTFRHNVGQVRSRSPNAYLYGVVKASAYGFGLDLVVPAIADLVDGFATSSLVDARRISSMTRDNGILVYATPEFMQPILDPRLTMTAWDRRSLDLVLRSEVGIAVKVDIGLGRIGFPPSMTAGVISEIEGAGRSCELLYAHQSHPGGDADRTRDERDRFVALAAELRGRGSSIARAMVASSAGVMAHDGMTLDAVNCGHAIYGFAIPPPTRESCDLREPTVELSAAVLQVRRFDRHQRVGYADGVRLERDTTLAVVAAGYGDGYPRAGQVEGGGIVNGVFAPFAVAPTVEYCVLDVTGIPCKPADRACFVTRSALPFSQAAAWAHRGELEFAAGLRADLVLVGHASAQGHLA